MKTIEVLGTKREKVGKIDAKKMRREKLIPCVMYHKDGNVFFSLPELQAKELIRTEDTYLVKMTVDGNTYNSIIREVQFHPVFDYILHMDFLAVEEGKSVDLELPLKLQGTSKGVLAGGVLVQKMRRVKVRGEYTKLPEKVYADISHLDLGKSLKIKEVPQEGFLILNAKEIPVASVEIPRALRQQQGK